MKRNNCISFFENLLRISLATCRIVFATLETESSVVKNINITLNITYLQVGCGDKLWSRHKVLVAGLREQSRDGTLAHTLRLSVIGWRLIALKPVPRPKRQVPDILSLYTHVLGWPSVQYLPLALNC